MNKNIYYICIFPIDNKNRIGGAERRLLRTINQLNKENTTIKVITNAPNLEYLEKICNDRIFFKYVYLKDDNKITLLYNLIKILRNIKKSYIHLINTTFSSFVIFNISLFFKHKVILSIVDNPTVLKKISLFNKLITNYCLNKSYKIDWLYSYYNIFWKNSIIINKSTLTQYSFTDYSKFYSDNKNKINLILFSGRLIEFKQPMQLIYAVNKEKDFIRKNNYKIIMLGDGILKNKIVELISKLNLKDILTLDNVIEPSEYFNKSKIFVSLQIIDNYPSQSLLEAIASQNLVIATNVGDTNRLLNEDNSILINNINELSNALVYAIINYNNYTSKLIELRKSTLTTHNLQSSVNYFKNFYNI